QPPARQRRLQPRRTVPGQQLLLPPAPAAAGAAGRRAVVAAGWVRRQVELHADQLGPCCQALVLQPVRVNLSGHVVLGVTHDRLEQAFLAGRGHLPPPCLGLLRPRLTLPGPDFPCQPPTPPFTMVSYSAERDESHESAVGRPG